MAHIKTKATDGSPVEFIMNNPMQGSMKDVYFAPDKSYVVAFDRKQPISPLRRELLEKLVGLYRKSIFEQVGGDYWKNLFCFPEKIVEYDGMTGIVIPTIPSHFYFSASSSLAGNEKEGKWFANAKIFNRYVPVEEKGDLRGYLQICLKLVHAVRRLHAAGLAHTDLSYNNCLVDPIGGNVCIIGIDGLIVPGLFPPDVLGTPDFIAPEVLATMHLPLQNLDGTLNLNRKFSCWETDRHALAVLIYMFLLHRHPLRGGKVWNVDDDTQEKLEMGEKALFIEHPTDVSNRPILTDRDAGSMPWIDPEKLPYTTCGQFLQELFERAFIDGLHDPSKRPLASEWLKSLVKTFDMLLPCQNMNCVMKWFVFDNTTKPKCPYCETPYEDVLPVLDFYFCSKAGEAYKPDKSRLMVFNGQSLFLWHIDQTIFPNILLTEEQSKRVGYFQFHDGKWFLVNGSMSGMKNITTGQEIPLKGSIELTEGLQLLLKPGPTGRVVNVKIVNN